MVKNTKPKLNKNIRYKMEKISKVYKNNKRQKMIIFTLQNKKSNLTKKDIEDNINFIKDMALRKGLKCELKSTVLMGIGWRDPLGGKCKITDEKLRTTDFLAHYTKKGYDVSKIHYSNIMEVQLFEIDDTGKSGKNNDCFFECLKEAFEGKSYMPTKINTAIKFKKFLKLQRNDGVPMNDETILKIEDMIKTNIIINGDFVYDKIKKYGSTINIMFSNGHCTLQNKPSQIWNLHNKIKSKEERQLRVFRLKEKEFYIYDGKTITKTTSIKNVFNDKYHTIKTTDNLKEAYETLINEANELKKITNNKFNLYKLGSYKSAVHYGLYLKSNINDHDDLKQKEAEWIQKGFLGGLIWAKNDTKLHDATCLDVNKKLCVYITI